MIFGIETLDAGFCEELAPLLVLHHFEISHFPEIPLQPNFTVYENLAKQGLLKVFSVRGEEGALVGYSIFFVTPCLHHQHSLKATQDVLFLHPDHRGQGHHFMRYCEQQLVASGVDRIFIAYNHKRDLSSLLKRQGYELCETVYVKKLGSH